ncbi:helix-turn-helix transcriptional regulator [Candidatus Obscuribacterales bacterium]|nr:helix-turn-helix transcriptional regulator [Candidatus Obscuribacterales bacterium]
MNNDTLSQKCCPTDFVLHTLSTRWTLPLIKALALGPMRPSELTKKLTGISAKSLTQRLRQLEKVGVLTRTSYQEIPPRVIYELTARGRDLLYVLDALEELGQSWQRTLPEYSSWRPNDQCAHCYTHLSPGNPENSNGQNRAYDSEPDEQRNSEVSVETQFLAASSRRDGDELNQESMSDQAFRFADR